MLRTWHSKKTAFLHLSNHAGWIKCCNAIIHVVSICQKRQFVPKVSHVFLLATAMGNVIHSPHIYIHTQGVVLKKNILNSLFWWEWPQFPNRAAIYNYTEKNNFSMSFLISLSFSPSLNQPLINGRCKKKNLMDTVGEKNEYLHFLLYCFQWICKEGWRRK